jgi:hypothetical protein
MTVVNVALVSCGAGAQRHEQLRFGRYKKAIF